MEKKEMDGRELMKKLWKLKWYLLVVFVGSLVWALCGTKQYTSKIVIASESQVACEENRAYTYNRPENYDLGVQKTDNALDGKTYKDIVTGQQFCKGLLQDTVQTSDGEFVGTLQEYMVQCMPRHFWQKLPDLPEKQEVVLADQLTRMIDCSYDDITGINTVKVKTPDSRVSQMLASSVFNHLSDYIRGYQEKKMQLALAELEQTCEDAKSAYEAAQAAHSPEASRLENIYRNFQRQEVIYRAQMFYQVPITAIQAASISYAPNGPGVATKTIGMTLLVILLIIAWIYRKELIAWF